MQYQHDQEIGAVARLAATSRIAAHRSAVKLDFSISHDRNSVLILCIIVVAIFFLSRVVDTGDAAPKLKRLSLFERCLTLPVGTWSVPRKQSFRWVGGHVHNLTTSYFELKKFVGNKTASFTVEIALLFVFSLANSLFFVSFLRLSDLSHTQEQAGSMLKLSTQVVAQSPSHNRDGSEKVRTFDKRTHRHKPFDRQGFVSVMWLRHAQLRDLVEVL